MSDAVCAFVDEYGDASVGRGKAGSSNYFIVTAVLIRMEDVDRVRSEVEAVRVRYFPNGELKSSRLGAKRDSRRLKLLGDLNEIGLKHVSFAAEKAELHDSRGLAYKPSFFKYINKRLYERIAQAHDHVHVTADEHGTEEFMAGFERYFAKHFARDLFSKRTFQFANSKAEVLLQAADVISGSLARGLDGAKLSAKSSEIFESAMEGSLCLSVWPPRVVRQHDGDVAADEDFDPRLARHALSTAHKYLADQAVSRADRDDLVQARSALLERLIFDAQYKQATGFLSTAMLRHHLDVNCGLEVSEHQLRTGIIAKLRDAGVLIASGSKGYKLPSCRADVDAYIERAHTVVGPILDRVARAAESVSIATVGDVDVLDSPSGEVLRSLIRYHVESRRPSSHDVDG